MRTIWHITFGTYGARLHGGDRITVDRKHNTPGQSFVAPNTQQTRYERSLMQCDPVLLCRDERLFIEQHAPTICIRGGWNCLEQAAAPDHVHLLIEAPSATEGKTIRRLVKRWLSQSLNERFRSRERWWAEGGSTKVVKDESYLQNVTMYIKRQKTTREDRTGDGPAH